MAKAKHVQVLLSHVIGRHSLKNNYNNNNKDNTNSFKVLNDQELIGDIFLYENSKYGMKLDYRTRIFQSLHMMIEPDMPACDPFNDVELNEEGFLWNKLTKNKPKIFHFNGGGKRGYVNFNNKQKYKQILKQNQEAYQHLKQHEVNIVNFKLMKEEKKLMKEEKQLSFENICGEHLEEITKVT